MGAGALTVMPVEGEASELRTLLRDKKRMNQLFKDMCNHGHDKNDGRIYLKGAISLPEVILYMASDDKDPVLKNFSSEPLVITTAFAHCDKATKKKKGDKKKVTSNEQLSKKEFRNFLPTLYLFTHIFVVFEVGDCSIQDRKIFPKEFLAGKNKIAAIDQVEMKDISDEAWSNEFPMIDKNKNGYITFDEFCAYTVSNIVSTQFFLEGDAEDSDEDEVIISTESEGAGMKGLDKQTVDIIKATASVVAGHAEEITTLFYKTMFENSAAARTFFNVANQTEGRQAKALAASIIAYATHIDDLGSLTDAIELIITKHCGLQVLPEHYPIVHDNLMIAVGSVLGAAVTPEVATAWSNAVNFLAKVLYEAEEAKYALAESRSGGWRGWKEFTISNIETVATGVKTFTLVPKDGVIADGGFEFTPGQYLSVRLDMKQDGSEISTPRHYTVTSKPGEKFFTITTKCIEGGVVSGWMHSAAVGSFIQVSPPFGPFGLAAKEPKNAVLVSAGIGMTPMKAILDSHSASVVKALHVDKNQAAVPFYAHFEEVNKGKNQFVYTEGGRPDLTELAANLVKEVGADNHFYVCGPTSFMKDFVHALVAASIPRAQIVWEAFSPQLSCPV